MRDKRALGFSLRARLVASVIAVTESPGLRELRL